MNSESVRNLSHFFNTVANEYYTQVSADASIYEGEYEPATSDEEEEEFVVVKMNVDKFTSDEDNDSYTSNEDNDDDDDDDNGMYTQVTIENVHSDKEKSRVLRYLSKPINKGVTMLKCHGQSYRVIRENKIIVKVTKIPTQKVRIHRIRKRLR